MSAEPQSTDGGQAPTGGSPQAGSTAPPAGDEPQAGLSQAELAAELTRVRREAAGHRARATQLEKEKADLDASKLSDLEKAQRERDTSKAELDALKRDSQERINRYEVQLKAAALGIADPSDAVKLLDWDALEYAEDGTPKNVEAALRALLKAKPYLAGGNGNGGGNTMNPASGRGANPSIDDYRRMGKDRIAQMTAAEREQMFTVLARG